MRTKAIDTTFLLPAHAVFVLLSSFEVFPHALAGVTDRTYHERQNKLYRCTPEASGGGTPILSNYDQPHRLNRKEIIRQSQVMEDWNASRPGGRYANIFQPFHQVSVEFPCLRLWQHGDFITLHHGVAPLNASNRFDPCAPLILDDAVTAHAGRRDKASNALTSQYSIKDEIAAMYEGQTFIPWNAPQLVWASLVHNLRLARSRPGSTSMQILHTCDEDDPAGMLGGVLLGLTIKWYNPGEEFRIGYYFPLEEWLSKIAESEIGQPWWRDYIDAVMGYSNRAVIHRRIELSHAPWEEGLYMEERTVPNIEKGLFKTGRNFDYRAVMDRKLRTVATSKLSADAYCNICSDDFGPEKVAVKLPCNDQHIICRPCVYNSILERSPIEACCPYCRSPYFTANEITDLTYGLYNGIFYNHRDFTPAENFQRSCSDLDKYLATYSGDPDLPPTHPENFNRDPAYTYHNTNPHMLFDIWINLATLDSEMDHTEEETYRCTLYPEWVFTMEKMQYICRLIPSTTPHSLPALYGMFAANFHIEFAKACAHGNRISNPECVAMCERIMLGDFEPPQGLYRPGYGQFLARSWHRTLQFLRLRRCECNAKTLPPIEECSEKQLLDARRHWHGDREFYHPGVYDELFLKRTVEEVVASELRGMKKKKKKKSSRSSRSPRSPPEKSFAGIKKRVLGLRKRKGSK
ncbi:hypothetical protein AC578_1020 [Pseudocercospora eumusae]|uniref:RING-type domain-containing protein n=1 Tax=Pseudocercospora eumusae TaxID=321146 RepID=A0A139HTJ0_9PEZI|nr:hypothetical protein AC578_1020 [Pseudocercospora eumusae]